MRNFGISPSASQRLEPLLEFFGIDSRPSLIFPRTPFHADVFRSYSWSANVCGRKRWLLYPAGQEEFLKDRHGNLPFDVTAPDLRDTRIYPRYSQSQPPLEILQEAGEIVFIPSGWHHQVHNLVRAWIPPGTALGSGRGIPRVLLGWMDGSWDFQGKG